MNDEADCRTAPVTPGVLKNYIYLFKLHGKYDERGADVSVSRKMFALK